MEMFIENESKYDFEETLARVEEAIISAKWKVSYVHDLKETLLKNGMSVLPVKVLELCRPVHSVRILERDKERIYSSLMPCRVSVYEKSDGHTYISRMNAGSLAVSLGGVVEEVMGDAFKEMEGILDKFIVK